MLTCWDQVWDWKAYSCPFNKENRSCDRCVSGPKYTNIVELGCWNQGKSAWDNPQGQGGLGSDAPGRWSLEQTSEQKPFLVGPGVGFWCYSLWTAWIKSRSSKHRNFSFLFSGNSGCTFKAMPRCHGDEGITSSPLSNPHFVPHCIICW